MNISRFLLLFRRRLGPELAINGGFDADTNWSKGGGWTISGGTANASATGGSTLLNDGVSLVIGRTYETTFSITAETTAASGVSIFAGSGAAGAVRSGVGTYTQRLTCAGSTNLQFNARGAGGWEGSIDNVSCKLVL